MPTADLVHVRTVLAAICGSDLHVADLGLGAHGVPGPPGAPGHESVVEIVDDPSGVLRPGDRALAVPSAAASAAFATHQLVPARSLLPLGPQDVPARVILAQQLGTVVHALDTFWDGDVPATVAIVGAGTAGALMVHEARRRGATTIIVSDPHPSRREAAVAFGASRSVGAGSLHHAVLGATDGAGAGLVIDASGRDDGRDDALRALAQDGVLGMFGLPERAGPGPFDLHELFLRRARLVTANGAQRQPGLAAFHDALGQLRRGELDTSVLTMRTLPLYEVDRGFQLARRRDEVHKVLLTGATP